MVEMVAETEKAVAQRKEIEAKPEERIVAKVVRDAVAVADALSSDGVVRSIGELKSTIARTLTQLSDRLEEEISKYSQICRAITAKESELQEIYEIQRSASTLLAFLETQQRKQEEIQREFQTEKEQWEREIETTRAAWETEKKQHEQESHDRDAAEQKRRQRELEEYKYTFAREQQLARDQSSDELAKAQKELLDRQTQLEREWGEREKALAAGEQELADLRARAAGFAHELEAAAERAAADAVERAEQQHQAAQELLRRELEGEKNVLAAKIAALERTVKEQAEQLGRLEQQAEKAYAQVQEIAVRAIEGSASTKQLANLQQLFTDQVRKGSSSER
jgi:DNA repair exonuclease SbcCD ATPase subunit